MTMWVLFIYNKKKNYNLSPSKFVKVILINLLQERAGNSQISNSLLTEYYQL